MLFFTVVLALLAINAFCEVPVMAFDFRGGKDCGWTVNRHVHSSEATAEGFHVVSRDGYDPWAESPPIPNLPVGEYDKFLLQVYVKSDSTSLQLFYGEKFSADKSSRLNGTMRNDWELRSTYIPPLRPGDRLRIDPPAGNSEMTLGYITITPIKTLYKPDFIKANPVSGGAHVLNSGDLTLRHGNSWDDFVLEVAGQAFACGHDKPELVTILNGKPQAIQLAKESSKISGDEKTLTVVTTFKDDEGGAWTATRIFKATRPGTLEVTTSFRCDKTRDMAHVPWTTLFPGAGSFGSSKSQALFPGVEYLVDEPSSDIKDVTPLKANRVMVSEYKICFPMMAISANRRWLSIAWDYGKFPATVFDSPDRLFNSGGHLFALWSPGTQEERLENDFNVHKSIKWEANAVQSFTTRVSAGSGDDTMASAIDIFASSATMPELPVFQGGFQGALELLARGWLDSVSYENKMWRHAWVPMAGKRLPIFAGDPIVHMDYIAKKTSNPALAARIKARIDEVVPELLKSNRVSASVSHDFHGLYSSLYFNGTKTWLDANVRYAKQRLASFTPEGARPYMQLDPTKYDFGKTHWTNHANGYTAEALKGVGRIAVATGNAELRKLYLEALDKSLELYKDDVPRGAQVWEIPLHSPDILGAAHMLRNCLNGYRLSGNPKYLKHAEYWALTGIPFVYLQTPLPKVNPDGAYATIAVLGATSYDGTFWVGLPVQWCGCVYRNSLYQYIEHVQEPRRKAFWKRLADGITLTGLRITNQEGDGYDQKLWGLLPDAYGLHMRSKSPPSINPGTLQLTLPEAYSEQPIADKQVVEPGVIAHALGGIEVLPSTKTDAYAIELDLWPEKPTDVVISGVDAAPKSILWRGQAINAEWIENHKVLVATLEGKGKLEWTK